MKTRKNIIMIIAASALFALPSCSDFMDLKPTTEYLKEQVFEDAATTQSLINTIYDYVIDAAREHTTNGLTDDAYFTHNKGQIAVNEATCSASDLQWYGRGDCPFNWSQTYKGIYYANLVLENIDKVPEKAGFDLKQMKGETRFLRAYMYTNLVRGIGGVPIVDKTVSDYTKTEEMQIARSSIGDCLDFILKDLDEAIASLPTTAPLGRATKWAAVSLKARICLHIASPLYADRIINKLDVNQYASGLPARRNGAGDFSPSHVFTVSSSESIFDNTVFASFVNGRCARQLFRKGGSPSSGAPASDNSSSSEDGISPALVLSAVSECLSSSENGVFP